MNGLDQGQLSKSMQPIGLANSQHAPPHRPAPRCGSDSPHRRSDELGIARVTVAHGLAHLPRGSLCRPTAKEVCMYCTTQDSERYTSAAAVSTLGLPKGWE